ncbi:MAG: DUF2007 domain-containing protein [Pirellulales bacterium]|nr:DUF2007 domain-containing protein [Pirellulales bacterium]
MSLEKPVVVYRALNNIQARMLKQFLESEGINAFAIEDVTNIYQTIWGPGVATQLYRPKVLVDAADAPRARQLLREFEATAQNSTPGPNALDDSAWVDVLCDQCGEIASFPPDMPPEQWLCPHCDNTTVLPDDSPDLERD